MINSQKLNDFDTKYFINENEEISYVITRVLYEILDITDVYTNEKYRRKGYARKILEYIINNNIDKKIMLEVNENNVPAINLYSSLGFKTISKRKNYYKSETALIMER